MIYLDNAATTLHKPPEVVEAVSQAMQTLGNAGRGVNEASLDAARSIFGTRVKLASFFHVADPAQVAFTSNATESLNIALKGTLNPGDHVITTVTEHNSVLRPLYELMEQGVEVTHLPCDAKGNVTVDQFAGAIQSNTRAIVTSHASNVTGNVKDITALGQLAREHGLLFIVDAAQTAGILQIDVQAMHIDLLCFTGHKGMLGPQGTGGICVRPGLAVRPLKTGGSGVQTYNKHHPSQMPTALEAGTLNGHGIAGLSAAVDYLQKTTLQTIHARETALMKQFLELARQIDGIRLYGDYEAEDRCAIVSLNLPGLDSAAVGDALFNDYDISVRTGGHCAPLMHETFGTKETGAVRFSFSHFNTEEEIRTAGEALKDLAERTR